ncbi:MAG: DUF2283 domain-containing protein [Anaerolineales bacterium]|nr:DUF2283 domain-containing protein [Chloroflexota bacterium]MBL6980438.1 DUF2283 domain-containing protein [Anaerolineales bacterium]
MKFNYYRETDSLYIELSEEQAEDSLEITQNIVVDFNASKQPIGIDIQHASHFVDLSKLETKSLPIENLSVAS